MNSYLLSINGSWILLVVLLFLSAGLSFYFYRVTNPPVTKSKRNILWGLRTLSLFILFLVLFQPILSVISGILDKPKIAVMLDNSLSVAFADAQSDRKSQYLKAMSDLNLNSLNKEEFKTILFDNGIKELDKIEPDKFKFDGQLTNMTKPLQWLSDNINENNFQAGLMVTDGNFNTGDNPIYKAESIGKPLFIVGVGDTVQPKDIIVQSIITNTIAYIDKPLPININVKISGFYSGEAEIILLDNGNRLTEQNIIINPEKQNYTTIFEYKPTSSGIHKITVQIPEIKGEVTNKNNSLSEFINVLSNKRQITILAGSPSPDLSFIKNTLNSEKGIEIKTFIQKQGSEFYDNPPTSQDMKKTDLFVLIGFPINSTPNFVLDMLKSELAANKSILFVLSQQTDITKLKLIEDYLPFNTLSSRQQEYLAIPDFKKSSLSSPITRIKGTDTDIDEWNKLPPIYKTETFVKVKPESEIISTVKVNNVPLNEPLILTRQFQEAKSVAFLGYGLYRWKLLGYALDASKGKKDTPDLFETFINNSVKWLSTDLTKKNVVIKTTKKVFLKDERIEFIGQVYDASLNPIDNANVKIKITNGKESRDLILTSAGNGRYTGYLDNMPEGDYYYSGDAFTNDKKLGSDNGRFNIGELALEYQNLKMNYPLLKELAERTGGKFYFTNDTKNLISDIKKIKSFEPKSITKKSEYYIWNMTLLLGLAIVLFALEWFLRKRAGML